MPDNRYVSFLLGLAACVLGAVAVFNYAADPGNIFGKNPMIKACAEWLLDGHDVAVTQNFDDRLFQKYMIEHDARAYEVVVLGSSRSMGIGKDLFSEASLKNYSVSAASLEDDIALYFLYEQFHGTPQRVVICADAWLLNRNNKKTRWRTLAEEYMMGCSKLLGQTVYTEVVDVERYKQLFSWAYFTEGVKQARESFGGGYCLADDKTAIPFNADIICPDGSHIPSAKEQANNAAVEARTYISGRVYGLEEFDVLDDEFQTQMKGFLSYLRRHGIEVVLYLPPYHPIVYSHFLETGKYQRVIDTERYFRECALEYRCSVMGSYDPMKCGVSNEDFLDGMHLRREAMYRMLHEKL